MTAKSERHCIDARTASEGARCARTAFLSVIGSIRSITLRLVLNVFAANWLSDFALRCGTASFGRRRAYLSLVWFSNLDMVETRVLLSRTCPPPSWSCTPMEFIMSLYAIADADTPVKMLESTAISSYVCLGSLRLLSVLVLHAPSQCSTCSMSCPFRGRCPVTTFTTA